MVSVTNYRKRQSKDGRSFIVLELTGGLEMVQSEKTGKFYATVRKCTVSTTFDEQVAKHLIGTQIKGQIVRVPSEPYDWTDENTGEVITLAHRWSYLPEGATTPVMEEV